MPRIRLIHWNPAEAAERATRLPDDEFDVDHAPLDPTGLRALRANPPDALLIDLSRLPSHGRDIGVSMRQTRATRGIPLVFVDGAPAKVEPIRQLLPDAVYTDWPNIQPALRHAIANPPSQPVVLKSSLAGYSGTPLPRKLGIKPGYAVALPGAPHDFETTLGELPDRVTSPPPRPGPLRPHRLVRRLASGASAAGPALRPQRAGPGGLWICWPKKASGVKNRLIRTRRPRNRPRQRPRRLQNRRHRPNLVRPPLHPPQTPLTL